MSKKIERSLLYMAALIILQFRFLINFACNEIWMYLKKLILTNFKNYELAELGFSQKINCFTGNNGVGKTNILDAIHYLSLTKSFFNSIDSISIKHGEDYFTIRGTFDRSGAEDEIYCAFQKQKQKIVKKNSKEYRKLSEHVGRYPVVMISPADSALITEGSEERRKFLNKIISQYSPVYLDAVLNYARSMQQRNRVLKDMKLSSIGDGYDIISIYDDQLVKNGSVIYDERKKLIDELIPVFQEYYSLISSGRERVRLQYRSHLSNGDFEGQLRQSLSRDMILEYTTTGVHKDDLILEMDGYPVKSLGSQGQQKSYLVALKLAKFDYIQRMAGFPPILLLDDIFDKFDADRVEQIIRLVENNRFGQIFITDTHEGRLTKILSSHNTDYRLFSIDNNQPQQVSGSES